MSKCLAAFTKPEGSYPGYVNFTLEDDGSVTIILRADPTTRHASYICGYKADRGKEGVCTPGDERCNNYCNLAPWRGPMQDKPAESAECLYVECGATVSLRLTREQFQELFAELSGV